jgi:hypothetical protein
LLLVLKCQIDSLFYCNKEAYSMVVLPTFIQCIPTFQRGCCSAYLCIFQKKMFSWGDIRIMSFSHGRLTAQFQCL